MVAVNAEDGIDFLRRLVQFLGQFVRCRFPASRLFQLLVFLPDLVKLTGLLDGEPHRPGLFGQGVHDGLADPPHRIGDELDPLVWIESLGRLDETDIAIVDEVQQGKPAAFILVGYAHHVLEVAADERVHGLFVAFDYPAGDGLLLLPRQDGNVADLLQIRGE